MPVVRRAKISSDVHVKILNKTIAKNPLTRVKIKTFKISAGMGESIDNAAQPKRIIVGFVDKAFNSSDRNSFNLKNYGINFFSLYAKGMQIPSRSLQPNFSKDESLYVEAYHTLFSEIGIHFLNE